MQIPGLRDISYCPVHLIKDNYNLLQQGYFFAMDYGIDPTGAVSSSAGIQAAIDAANDWATTHLGMCGTVIIPAGNYLIDARINLRSYTHVKCEYGSRFIVPNAYASSIWYHDGLSILTRCKVEGGYYTQSGLGNTYTCIDLRSEDFANYIMWVEFRDMYIYYPDTGIYLLTNNDGWINGNIFKDIIIWRPVYGVDTSKSAAGFMTGNHFENIQVQCHTMTTHGFHNIQTYKSTFIGCRAWDLAGAQIGIEFVGGSYYNTVIGGSLGYIGTSLLVGTTRQIIIGYSEGYVQYGYGMHIGFNSDQCFIKHSGNVLTVTAPYGFGLAAGSPPFDLPRNTGNITAGTGITTDMQSGIMIYNGTAAVNITADPQIADAYKDGTRITIIGTSDVNTLTLDDGTGLALAGGVSMVLGQYDSITLVFNEAMGIWIEISRSNN